MKVIQVPFCFYPDPVGGTEVYVDQLARGLRGHGIDCVIVAPGDAGAGRYEHDGLPVRRFAVGTPVRDLRELYGLGCGDAARAFGAILDEERPDLVHLHAFTRAVSPRLVDEAKRRGIPVLFSYHTPTVSCQRGTLLERGTAVCDGALSVSRCTACTLEGMGLPAVAAAPLSRLAPAVGRALGARGRSGGPWTALRMTELLSVRHAELGRMLEEVDGVVAVCRWVADLLVRNGVSPERITLSRQGVADGVVAAAPRTEAESGSGPRLAVLGRVDPIKGLDVAIEAVRACPGLDVTLDVFAVPQPGAEAYEARLRRLAESDSRIRMMGRVPADQVGATLAEYDALLVPSQGLETGPLVVLEAFAVGTPVIGSDLGGIAELVRDGVDGLLVPPASREAWAAAIRRLTVDPWLLARLRGGIRPPRRMGEVANDMAALYARTVAPLAVAGPA